ncbi:MAG: nuclear transport factor 2 family protein [Burkholderiales bacterium]|nr:MAG: nuclear transport factor 2 family protein [Burkholderiales bacterium]TAG82323.1 MAG: nuclear transport factor 2 family protein [Betaproteobacteria bacterium]
MLNTADIAKFRHLEEALWIAETRFDPSYMNAIFAPDFFEIGRSGRVWSRDQLLNKSAPSIDAVLPLPSFAVREITSDVVQVTYVSQVTYDDTVEYGRRSSIWSRADTKAGWQLRFHQGTPFVPELN